MMIEIFTYPFMQRALLVGILTGLTTGLLGVFVILRRSSFFGDAIAHASLAGVALGLFLGISPLLSAAILVVLISLFLARIEQEGKFSIDTILGFIMPFFMALGVIILSFIPGYQPELVSFLFGNILAISWLNLAIIFLLSILIVFFILVFKDKLVFVTFDEDGAKIHGINSSQLLNLYYLLLSLAIIIGLKAMGVILINALLIIPAATAKTLARSLSEMFLLTPMIGILAVVVGLLTSYYFNIPSGSAIVVFSGILFLLTLFFSKK